MPRGGKRQGTPGKGYSNRTDLAQAPDMAQNTAATGGQETAPPPMDAPQGPPMRTPEDSPMLTDPTQRPDEPITAGLPIGAGVGPGPDPRLSETRNLKKYLPLLGMYIDNANTPDSVRSLFRYIKSS